MPLGPYSVGGSQVSGTTVPVRVSPHKHLIGPGYSVTPVAPHSFT